MWHWFRCLVQACIALEYPPSPAPGGNFIPPANLISEIAGSGAQRRNAGLRPTPTDMVHFDISPDNTLVSRLDHGPPHDDHRDLPALKLNDFGFARRFTREIRRRNPAAMWAARGPAKWDFITPAGCTV